jgi:transglutaminase-like putative cysteine protease
MSEATQDEDARESWLSTALRTLVHAITGFVAAFPLTVEEAMFAAAIGGALGSLAGRFTGHSRVRMIVVVPSALLAVVLLFVVHALVVGSSGLAAWLGPATLLRAGEALLFGCIAAIVSFVLRALSARRRAFAILELGYIASAFATLVIAHRNGAIHRPFEIADPLIASGWDPSLAFFLIGGGGVLVSALLLLSERRLFRSALHLGALGVLVLVFLSITALFGVPTPPVSDDALGLRGEGEDEDEARRREREQQQRQDDELEFRDNYDSEQNRIPVGVVLFHDDYSPPTGVYYFRQGAFSQYNGRRLVATTIAGVDDDIATVFPSRPMRVDPRDYHRPYRRKIETTVALLADHTRPIGLEAALELRPSENPDARRFRRVYRVMSASLDVASYSDLLPSRLGDPSWSDAVWAQYTEGPSDPRYRDLAQRIVHEVLPENLRSNPIAQAYAIQWWLSDRGTYSLRSNHASATDPTADFLFGDLTGYCVHFAHASTYLMRSLGVPSRVATGYAVDESARQGGSAVLINGQTSHAWPEVYVDGAGWVIMDVSPQTVVSAGPAPPDPDLQRLLADLVRGERPLPIEGTPPPKVDELAETILLVVAQVLGGALLCAFAFLFGMKSWRRLAPLIVSPAHRARVSYRAALDRLSDVAIRREYGETQEAFARRMATVSPSIASLTRSHLAVRYGKGVIGDPRETLAVVAREIRDAYPWWRRALGALHPWSWLRTR